MTKGKKFLLAGVAATFVSLTAGTSQVSAQTTRCNLDGDWLASGSSGDGTKYTGSPVRITSFGNPTLGGYRVAWTYDNNRVVTGTGLDLDNYLAVGYRDSAGGVTGVVIYKISANCNRLEGYYIESDGKMDTTSKEADETLVRKS